MRCYGVVGDVTSGDLVGRAGRLVVVLAFALGDGVVDGVACVAEEADQLAADPREDFAALAGDLAADLAENVDQIADVADDSAGLVDCLLDAGAEGVDLVLRTLDLDGDGALTVLLADLDADAEVLALLGLDVDAGSGLLFGFRGHDCSSCWELVG